MSLYDYRRSLILAVDDPPFAALIMAAMRKADTDNVARLRSVFPELWAELTQRYHAPGGAITPAEARALAAQAEEDDP